MRLLVLIALLTGCDRAFSLVAVTTRVDAQVDAPGTDAPLPLGCADGTREGFSDPVMFPLIAACAGAWSVPGIYPEPPVQCGRAAGNDGTNPQGTGCTATDVCLAGWHLCRSKLEVLARTQPTRSCAKLDAGPSMFFATLQSGPGGGLCGDVGLNDVFGCGSLGLAPPGSSCTPLDRWSSENCNGLQGVGGWSCAAPEEARNIKKSDPLIGGGVLCCRDEL